MIVHRIPQGWRHAAVAISACALVAGSIAAAQTPAIITRSSIGLSLARVMLVAAEAEAKRNKVEVSIVIVDDRGALILAQRMDGASHTTIDVATSKARTAAHLRTTTADLGALYKGDAPELASVGWHLPYLGGLALIGGGVPVLRKTEVIGGIGVSGALPAIDAQIAAAGAAIAGQP